MNTLILGATGGIGSALASQLAAAGHTLFLAGRNASRLREVAAPLAATAIPCDIGHELEVQALLAEAGAGGLDLVVYAVGDIVLGSISDSHSADVMRIWTANYLGVHLVLKHAAPLLTPTARIYLLGARPELVEAKQFASYAASKAALAALARVAAQELRRGVSLVLPGPVDTAFWQKLGGKVPRNAITASSVAAAIVADLALAKATPELRV
jgi:NAD(P)-dependent dehydrogenase (short-subunit alcohol dehydrogenase family)